MLQLTILLVAQILLATSSGHALGAEKLRGEPVAPDTVESGRLIFHQLLRPVGEEVYSLTFADNRYTLSVRFIHDDRGRRTDLHMEMRYRSDFTTESVSSRTGARFEPIMRLAESGIVTVRDDTSERSVPAPDRLVAIDGHAPYVSQMMAIRYWLTNGRPDSFSPPLPCRRGRWESRAKSAQFRSESEQIS